MAFAGVSLVRLKSLCHLGKYIVTEGKTGTIWPRDVQWYRTKARTVQETVTSRFDTKRDNETANLLKEFPDPKHLLNATICQSLRTSDLSQYIQYSCVEHAGIKKATVTLQWPCKIQEEGHADKKVDAERFAAAAACLRLREMGIIGPNNQLPRRRAVGNRTLRFLDDDDNLSTTNKIYKESDSKKCQSAKDSSVAEAFSLFPQPKSVLTKVMGLAMSSKRIKELIQFKTTGGKFKNCSLSLHWPEQMKFSAKASTKVMAERKAAALACMKLKELGLLDENNKPLTHAKYHHEKVQEAMQQQRSPVPVEIPVYLEDDLRNYLEQYPVGTELQSFEEEEVKEQQLEQKHEEEDLTDAITGRLYRPLSLQQAQALSFHLQETWEKANPALGVELPVDAHRQRVVSAIKSSRVVVIAGETGCGKTTRIPRFLLEENVRSGKGANCNILVTQPRRISAVSVAHRVAKEMGPDLKHSVGYQVRLESRPPEHSGGALLFLTVGVLLRKLQSNPGLTGISHVVVDEVHERDINTDLLLALLRSCLKKNPDLRVVLMSATGDNQKLARYFGGCPVVKVPGFMHPVREHFLEDVLREMGRPMPVHDGLTFNHKQEGRQEVTTAVDLVADVIEHIDRHGEPGGVLCFLPGWQEIKSVQEKLMERPHFSTHSHLILPLHSGLSVANQQEVFQHPSVGQRKIVLTTNIAETSITIDDIVHVVDTGVHKEQNYDPNTKVSCLDTVWVSRSNVTQRKGRAGRCQPGQSYHLFSSKQLESLTPFPIPEILRTPLENLVVQAKIHSPKSKAVDFLSQVMDSPDLEAIQYAVQNLQNIDILDEKEMLTPLGRRVACLSCDPCLGKVLVLGALFRCLLPLLSVAACLTRDPFHNSLQNRSEIKKVKEALGVSSYSDYAVFIRAVLGWRRVQREERLERDAYLEEHCLSRTSLRFISGLMSQFSANLHEAKLVSHSNKCLSDDSLCNRHSNEFELVNAVLLAGLYPNLIQVKKGIVTRGGRFQPNKLSFRILSGPAILHRSSVNRGKDMFLSRWLTFYSAVKSNGNVFIRDSSPVHPLALLLFTNANIVERVNRDRVRLSFSGCPLVHLELSVETWKLLRELRTSIQTMMYRNLSDSRNITINAVQDRRLISLVTDLLNSSASNHLFDGLMT
ncbi:ATP-dependent RNA helicase DHX30 [Antennarius striatus]|uniref:ATP-dependent RNA helicase DHX30 n=1 Tax=Antennarius striatus TaxID=241820 RepID=UPI0035B27704